MCGSVFPAEIRLRNRAACHGETTAAVFELLGQGVEPVEVVMRLKLPATAVEALRRHWVAMRGSYIVDREVAAEICAVRGTTIRDATGLLQDLRATRPPVCDGCKADLGWVNDSRAAAFWGVRLMIGPPACE